MVGRWRTTREAEHGWLHGCERSEPEWAATVFVPAAVFGRAEVAVVTAAGARALPHDARVFSFPGQEDLPEEPTVAQLLADTVVDEVVALGNQPVEPDQVVRTQRFLRPIVTATGLLLLVRPGRGSVLLPFEQPNPTPCCLDH